MGAISSHRSPLLANLYMNRYLKSFVFGGSPALRWFHAMGLTLNEQKTRVCDGRRESFNFLGYTFGPMRYRKDDGSHTRACTGDPR